MSTPPTDQELDTLFRDELQRVAVAWHAQRQQADRPHATRLLRPVLAAVAVFTAAAIFVVVVLAVHLAGAGSTPSVGPAVRPTVTPSATAQGYTPLSPPPSGVDLYWAPSPHQLIPGVTQQLAAYDWSGAVRGGLRLATPLENQLPILPSPRGSRLLIAGYGAYSVIDVRGALVGTLPSIDHTPMWSDDETTLCYIGPKGSATDATSLYVVQPGGTPRRVVAGGAGLFQGGPQVLACSTRNDLALILTHPTVNAPMGVLVVRLSTGALLRTLPLPGIPADAGGPGLWAVVASPDGKLVAVTDATGAQATILDSTSGAVLGTSPGPVTGFSSDGSRVVTSTEVLNWRTGQVVAAPAGCCWPQLKVDPGSSALIVAVQEQTTPSPSPAARVASSLPIDSVLIGPTGATRLVVRAPDEVMWDN
jgi:hypothetical protein